MILKCEAWSYDGARQLAETFNFWLGAHQVDCGIGIQNGATCVLMYIGPEHLRKKQVREMGRVIRDTFRLVENGPRLCKPTEDERRDIRAMTESHWAGVEAQ